MRSLALTRRALSRNVRLISPNLALAAPLARFHAWNRESAKVDSSTQPVYDVYDKTGLVNTSTGESKPKEAHAPPDERTLQLGKSKSQAPRLSARLTPISHSHSPRETPYAPSFASTARDIVTRDIATSIPLHPPSSSYCVRKDTLHWRFMDGTRRLGTITHPRKCQARDHVRENGQEWRKQCGT